MQERAGHGRPDRRTSSSRRSSSFATQNPIEQEGTYPLPEAQLDRFMFSVNVGYPSDDEEVQIVERTTTGEQAPVEPVLDRDLLIELQGLVRRLPTSQDVNRYAVRLARASRPAARRFRASCGAGCSGAPVRARAST